MSNITEREIKQAVRNRYADLALGKRSCCDSSCCEPGAGGKLIPQESLATAASCGSPVAQASLVPGQVVLDLGSGGGVDVFRASKAVESSGRVIGVDSTPEMIVKSRQTAETHGYGNVEFRLGEIEHLPVQDSTVDVVISNCVLNLVPDKKLAFKEIYRVLKPNGQIVISDMVATGNSKMELTNADDWAACIAGAIPVDDYEHGLIEVGFKDVRHVDENSPLNETCCEQGLSVKSVTWFATKPSS